MKKKIPETSIKWERKSSVRVFYAIIMFVSVIYVMYKVPEKIREQKKNDYFGMTFGKVNSIEPFTTVHQGFDGAKTVAPYYRVDYTYEVNGKIYTNSNNMPNNGIYGNWMEKMREFDSNIEIKVKYKVSNPAESLIDVSFLPGD